MKKFQLFIGILVLTALTSCGSTEGFKIKTSINNYYYYYNRFKDACPSEKKAECPQVLDQGLALDEWYKRISEAKEANERGGKLPLQLEALKKAQNVSESKCNGW